MRNWAGNVEFGADSIVQPRSVAELQEVVATCTAAGRRARALGAAHSFSRVADTDGVMIATDGLQGIVGVVGASTVTIEGGVRYAELAPYLHARGLALANLPSLPHVTVAGAAATGTHGSGDRNGGLATAIEAVELVTAAGELLTVGRGDPDGPAAGVALGALGVVARLVLRVGPTFDVAQRVHVDVPFDAAVGALDAVLASAYSVSLFTDWTDDRFHQVWRKHRLDEMDGPVDHIVDGLGDLLGPPATVPLHPLPGLSADACTEQLGIPGPWHERLPHFRPDATPSAGAELQSEYFVDRRDGPDALRALRAMAADLRPVVLVTEVRSIAADELWLSPAYGRDSVAIHFTWRLEPRAVRALLPRVERALAPFVPRPHWAKLTTIDPATVRARSPRFDDFARCRARLDPTGTFTGPFVDALFD
jgi:xylitol oxidase